MSAVKETGDINRLFNLIGLNWFAARKLCVVCHVYGYDLFNKSYSWNC